MGVAAYARGVAAEFALSAAVAALLSVVAMQGFVVDPALQFNPLLVGGASCLLQAVLYAAAWRRRGAAWGALAYAALAAGAVALALATSTGADPLADVEENHLVVALVLVLVNLAVFLLGRTPAGLVVLAAAGLFCCAFVEFAYHAGLVLPTVLFCACLTALFAARSYACSVRAADDLGTPAFGRAALSGLVVALLAAGLSYAVWALLVAPLEPGRLEPKLFIEERTFETVPVDNPVELVKVEDPAQATVTLTDEVIYGSIPVEVQADQATLEQVEEFVEAARAQVGSQDVFSLTVDEENGVYLYTYTLPSLWWLALLALPFVLAGLAVLVRRLLRSRARAAMAARPAREQVGLIYDRCLRRFAKLGFGKPAAQTPDEYARLSAGRMEAFLRGGDCPVSWAYVTRAYERCHYGPAEPDEAELAACWDFYDGFLPCAVRLVGRPRYCLKYFWIL